MAALFALPGCAHYYWPAGPQESPEAVGPERIGRLELVGIQSGTDLIDTPSKQSPDAETGVTPDPALSMSPVNYTIGAMLGLGDSWEVGVRVQPFAPLLARAKYQLTGKPEPQGEFGDFSAAAGVSAGALMGLSSGQATFFYTGNAALIGGVRLGKKHLLQLAPFLSLAGLTGIPAAEGSGMRYGAELGYQFDSAALLLRLGVSYAAGSFTHGTTGSCQAGGIFPGLLFGLKL